MKRLAFTLGTLWLLLPVVPLLYAGDGRADGSDFAMWLFLGFCALIVALQLVPAIKRLLGIAREPSAKPAAVKQGGKP
jgi:hypothetical protein